MRTEKMGEEPWVKDVNAFLSRGPGILVRLRGLPYECTALQVVEFFRRGEPAEVVDGEEGVFFVKKPDGKSTGDAFVLFRTDSEGSAGMSKHRQLIGTRYIELFRTSFPEMEQIIRRTLEAKSRPHVPRTTQIQTLHQVLAPQPAIPAGNSKDCIRLRGLPFEAQVQHILDFLGPHAQNIMLQGVHMVLNVMGQPTGEVFIQMNSEDSASRAAAYCHSNVMIIGKKQRYVEVFQCSGEEVATLLTEAPPLATSALGDMLPTMIPLFPPAMLDQSPPAPPPPAPAPPSLQGPPPPILYVIVSSPPPPEQAFFTPSPLQEWIPEYPINHQMGIHPPNYFVS